jgi:cytochrome c biogenesis factor
MRSPIILLGLGGWLVLAEMIHLGLRVNDVRLPVLHTMLAPLLFLLALVIGGAALRQLCRRKSIAASIAHGGVALLLLGTVISGYAGRMQQGFLPIGITARAGVHTFCVRHITQPAPYLSRAEVIVDGRTGWVEITYDPRFNIALRRPWIVHQWWGDLHLAPLAIVNAPATINGRTIPPGIQVELTSKPAIALVWLGISGIAFGILLALFRIRLRRDFQRGTMRDNVCNAV